MSIATVGDGIEANRRWTFGEDTPKHFDRHILRSVPRYEDGHELILGLSDFFVSVDSVCYDLGCSTGTLTQKLARRHPQSVRWVGLDIEPNMIAEAESARATAGEGLKNIEFAVGDISVWDYAKSDFIVAYYTCQFVRPRSRQDLLQRIYNTLNWGGALLLFEKVRGPDARFQDILNSLYVEHKLREGYEPAEIVEKSRSLKGVLEPFSTEGNVGLLRRAGFVDIVTIFKHICFEGFLCIK